MATQHLAEFNHLLGKAREAKKHPDARHVMSTGEKLTVALVLNKPEWLVEMDYTLAEAVDRVGPEWCGHLLPVQRRLTDED